MPVYKFYIYFTGLICHMGDDPSEKQFAAIVRDPDHHTPLVLVDDKKYPVDPKAECLKFEIVEKGVSLISESVAKTKSPFLRLVPSLSTLMGGIPKLNIKNVAIPVYYPSAYAGTTELRVARLYEEKGLYTRAGIRRWGPECVARITGIELTTQYPDSKLYVVSFDKAGTKSRFHPPLDVHSCVLIANAEIDQPKGPGHVQKYGALLADADNQVTVTKPEKRDQDPEITPLCGWVDQAPIESANDVECGNTNWP